MSNTIREEDLLRYIAERISLVEQYTQSGRDSFLAQPVLSTESARSDTLETFIGGSRSQTSPRGQRRRKR